MSQDQFLSLGRSVLVLRIILLSLTGSCLIVLGVALLLHFNGAMPGNGNFLITPMAIGWSALAAVLYFVVPQLQIAAARNRLAQQPPGEDAVALVTVHRSAAIVGAAQCEGGALFAIIAFMIEGNIYNLVAAALLRALLIIQWPTEERVRMWMIAQYEKIAEMRNNAGTP